MKQLYAVGDVCPLSPTCEECGCSCHPHDSNLAYLSWQEGGFCVECNDRLFRAEQAELKAMAY